ncbi:MAG: DUF1284 domain-containing protein [Nitrospirae bacterium]|nr:DUF1284 domain-containing protein [Nitrospirota bacterium]
MSKTFKMPCELRGHHLICLHFFSGEGYDAEFIENLNNVMAAAKAGACRVHNGADAVCARCPSLQDDRCTHSDDAEDDIAAIDALALRLLDVSHGQYLLWQDIRNMLPSIFHEWYVSSCKGCGWKWACERKALYRELEKAASPLR